MQRTSFNDSWQVITSREWFDMTNEQPKPVTLPHDAMIETERNENSPYWFPYGGFMGEDKTYTKTFEVPAEWVGKKVQIEFEGVYTNSTVYCNNVIVARQPYGYTRFIADCSDQVHEGSNQIKVLTRAGAAPSSRWYPGEGIYRDTWLMVSENVRILPWGIRVTTNECDAEAAVLTTDITVRNDNMREEKLILRQTILKDGEEVASSWVPFCVKGAKEETVHQNFYIAKPDLWCPETPALYDIKAELVLGETVIDTLSDRFGIRTVRIDPVRGFCVNGKSYKLRGGCIHHDNGPIGSAEFDAAARRRVKLMRQAGYNAIRSSHNPMSMALLRACDELGVFVMDETFDTWNVPKSAYDYNLFFEEWWQHDTYAMVAKDYNHPSVVFYSIGNEISERDGSGDGGMWVRRQAEYIRSLDHTRGVTSALCGIHDPNAVHAKRISYTGKKGIAGVPGLSDPLSKDLFFVEKSADYSAGLDMIGLNYLYNIYEEIEAAHPNRVLCGTESIIAQYAPLWEKVEKYPYLIGDFCWTAWEYLGETGCGKIDYHEDGWERSLSAFMGSYPWIMAYCGDFDLTGMRRTQSYFREIVWGLRKAPYIAVQRPARHDQHVAYSSWSWDDTVASWTWPGFEGKETDIEVYANAEEAELLINGRSLGRKKIEGCIALWTAAYEPGTIEAVAYTGGVEQGRYELKTVKAASRLRVQAETVGVDGTLKAGERDLCYIRIDTVDEDGNYVYADPEIKVTVEGAGTLMGLGSGDPVTKHNYWEDHCTLFDGTAIAIIRSGKEKGLITVTVRADGLPEETITIKAE